MSWGFWASDQAPIVGEILNALSEAQEFKEVTNTAQAEAFVRSYWDSKEELKMKFSRLITQFHD